MFSNPWTSPRRRSSELVCCQSVSPVTAAPTAPARPTPMAASAARSWARLSNRELSPLSTLRGGCRLGLDGGDGLTTCRAESREHGDRSRRRLERRQRRLAVHFRRAVPANLDAEDFR